MRITMVFSLAMLFSLGTVAQAQPPKPNYCFGFLNAVPNRPNLPEDEANRIQKAHIGHLEALGKKGWLVGAGPIGTPGPKRGVVISKCKSVEEALEMAAADPAVKNGRLTAEVYLWIGTPAIGEAYRKAQEANPGAPFKMAKYALVLVHPGEKWKGIPDRTIVAAHLAYLDSLKKAGKFGAGGPFPTAQDPIGVFILRATVNEARDIIERDPMLGGGAGRFEYFEWYAAEGTLPE